jgi:hypothetical protein
MYLPLTDITGNSPCTFELVLGSFDGKEWVRKDLYIARDTRRLGATSTTLGSDTLSVTFLYVLLFARLSQCQTTKTCAPISS